MKQLFSIFIVPLILQMKKIKLGWVSGALTFPPMLEFFPSKILAPGRKCEQKMFLMLGLFCLLTGMLVTQVCSIGENSSIYILVKCTFLLDNYTLKKLMFKMATRKNTNASIVVLSDFKKKVLELRIVNKLASKLLAKFDLI